MLVFLLFFRLFSMVSYLNMEKNPEKCRYISRIFQLLNKCSRVAMENGFSPEKVFHDLLYFITLFLLVRFFDAFFSLNIFAYLHGYSYAHFSGDIGTHFSGYLCRHILALSVHNLLFTGLFVL